MYDNIIEKNMPKSVGVKKASMFYTVADLKRCGGSPVIVDCAFHITERGDNTKQYWRTTNCFQQVEQAIPT